MRSAGDAERPGPGQMMAIRELKVCLLGVSKGDRGVASPFPSFLPLFAPQVEAMGAGVLAKPGTLSRFPGGAASPGAGRGGGARPQKIPPRRNLAAAHRPPRGGGRL